MLQLSVSFFLLQACVLVSIKYIYYPNNNHGISGAWIAVLAFTQITFIAESLNVLPLTAIMSSHVTDRCKCGVQFTGNKRIFDSFFEIASQDAHSLSLPEIRSCKCRDFVTFQDFTFAKQQGLC